MGKQSKRPCPALQRIISASECGNWRQTRFACPESCPYNPFTLAHHDALLETERQFDEKTVQRLMDETTDPSALNQLIAETKSETEFMGVVLQQIYFHREAGLTLAERWARDGSLGWKNDERVFLAARQRLRLALLEVQRVPDADRVEVMDLLEPGSAPKVIVDRQLAARLGRFEVFFGWIYPLPHFWRIVGTALPLPNWWSLDSLEMVRELARHLGGPVETTELSRWLAGALPRVLGALEATSVRRQQLMAEKVDAEFGAADYELAAPFAECRARLDANSHLQAAPVNDAERGEGFLEARTWPEASGAPALADETGPMIGRILLGHVFWRVEALGVERQARLRREFETTMGGTMKFFREHRRDWAAAAAREWPEPDLALVPPRLLEGLPQMKPGLLRSGGDGGRVVEDFAAVRGPSFADEPMPALEGHSPRAAAADARLRPRLIALMKSLIWSQDLENLRTGRNDDINGLVRDLGLHEIDVPPPPPRPPQDPFPDSDEWTADGDDLVTGADMPLVGEPLTLEMASERLPAALAEFTVERAPGDEWGEALDRMIDDVDELVRDVLSDDEFDFFVLFAAAAGAVLAPRGQEVPDLDVWVMATNLERELARLPVRIEEALPGEMAKVSLDTCSQPAVLRLLMEELLAQVDAEPKKRRPDGPKQVTMILLLKVVINEIDRRLRGTG